MALSGIPIDPQQCIGDSLEVLNNSFIELDSRTVDLSSGLSTLTLVVGASSGNLYTTIQEVSSNLYTLIQETSSEGGLAVPVKFSFTGNGSQTVFTLTGSNLSNSALSYRVTLNGVVQDPEVDFNISGLDLVFTTPPPSGVSIVVVSAETVGTVTLSSVGGGGGATGGGTDEVIFLNDQVITTDFTIPPGKNGMSAGPIQIASGVTLTLSPSSTYTVVL